MTEEQIVTTINRVASANTYLRQALRVCKKVHGDEREVKADLKVAMEDLRTALKQLEEQWQD